MVFQSMCSSCITLKELGHEMDVLESAKIGCCITLKELGHEMDF